MYRRPHPHLLRSHSESRLADLALVVQLPTDVVEVVLDIMDGVDDDTSQGVLNVRRELSTAGRPTQCHG
jgi:hypothetical protein